MIMAIIGGMVGAILFLVVLAAAYFLLHDNK
jgi:hypothetical protein